MFVELIKKINSLSLSRSLYDNLKLHRWFYWENMMGTFMCAYDFIVLEQRTSVRIRSYNVVFVVCFLLGNFPASEFYMPTFRNTLSVPSSQASRWIIIHLLAYEDGIDRVSRNVGIKYPDDGELPRRKHTTWILRFVRPCIVV
jgi:hypothetical protein